jgi:hypothetical protein
MAPPEITAQICYLLIVPLKSPRPEGVRAAVNVKKDVPYFFDVDIDFLAAGERHLTAAGAPVCVRKQVLDEEFWLAECRFDLPNFLAESAITHKQTIQTALKKQLQQEFGYSGAFIEEYVILLLDKINTAPEEFVSRHAMSLARLLRSMDKPLTPKETEEILIARTRYGQGDLTIVDWEGALLMAADGDFDSEIELLKIGSYQLLRYRMLDRAIERNLEILRQRVTGNGRRKPISKRKMLPEIIEQRLSLLLDFEKIDQALLLIGDWYSAQVYRLIVDEFYLDEWKAIVSAKLDNLAAIDEIVRQNLAFSWDRLLDIIEIAGWFFLLVGYFVLFFIDIGWFN